MDQLIGIFPTPLMCCRQAIPQTLVEALIEQFEESATSANVRTALLSHTPMANPQSHQNYQAVMKHVGPKIIQFGETLLGEQLRWGVKEIWINKMEQGGAQKLHNHANSFISGVIYLTKIADGASTVFHRNMSTTGPVMSNANERCKMNEFNAPVFKAPEVGPGDMVLFPSYVLHEVPPNPGAPRMTAAFNALPERVDSWGYTVQFR